MSCQVGGCQRCVEAMPGSTEAVGVRGLEDFVAEFSLLMLVLDGLGLMFTL